MSAQASVSITRARRGIGLAALGHCLSRYASRAFLSTVVQDQIFASPPPQPHHLRRTQSSPRNHGRDNPNAQAILQSAVAATAPRNVWTREEIAQIYHQPLMELVFQSVSNRLMHLLSLAPALLTPRRRRPTSTAASTTPPKSSSVR